MHSVDHLKVTWMDAAQRSATTAPPLLEPLRLGALCPPPQPLGSRLLLRLSLKLHDDVLEDIADCCLVHAAAALLTSALCPMGIRSSSIQATNASLFAAPVLIISRLLRLAITQHQIVHYLVGPVRIAVGNARGHQPSSMPAVVRDGQRTRCHSNDIRCVCSDPVLAEKQSVAR